MMVRRIPLAMREPATIALLLAVGAALRVGRFVLGTQAHAMGEARNVAVALAQGRGFADAYRIGEGATAHVSPVTPGIAAAVYRIFGVDGALAEIVLGCWSVGLALATYGLLYRAFGKLGVPVRPRLVALALLCVAPTFFWVEAVDFRVWDGGLAACLTAWFLNRLLSVQVLDIRSTWPLAAIGASLFLVNAIWGIAAYACAAVYCLTRAPLKQLAGTIAVAAVALLAVTAPWAIRNARVMDRPVLLRSNAGLELALAMHPAAVDTADPAATFLARLNAIHPTMGDVPYRAMQRAGGEASYADALGRETWSWIAAEPAAALRLAGRHMRQAIFPEGWQFSVLGGSVLGGYLRSLFVRLVALFGIAGIALALHARRPGWIYPALLVAVPTLEMAPFQPVQRYTYLFYPILMFAAAGCATWATRWWRRRTARTGRATTGPAAA